MMTMFDVFTSWPTLLKSNTEQLSKMAHVLDGKTSKDITFTAIDQNGDLAEYVLGSIEGNARFLLGYCNPGFRLAAYHFMVIDPAVSEEEADILYNIKGHPANPKYWLEHGFTPFLEGDELGVPHPSYFTESSSDIEDSSYEFTFRGKSYLADPDNQLVYCTSTGNVYSWDLIQNTFFSESNPDLFSVMAKPILEKPTVKKSIQWGESVLPIVRDIVPAPGSKVRLDSESYGIVYPTYISVEDSNGVSKSVNVLGECVSSIDLTSADINGMILLEFLRLYFNLDVASLETYVD